MTNDLDRDLRELFTRHETDVAGRGLTPPQDLTQRARRRQAVTIFIASVAVVAVSVAVLAGLDAIRASEPRPANPRPGPGPEIDWERVPSTDIDDDAILDVRTGEITSLPDGITSLDLAGGYAVAPGGDLLALQARTGGSTDNPFTTCGARPEGPFPVCQVFVVNTDGTNLRQLTDSPEGAAVGGWSPDGRTIVAIVDTGAGNDSGSERR